MPYSRFATAAAIVVAFLAAAIVVRFLQVVVHRAIDALEIVSSENRAAVHARARQLLGALALLAYGLAAIASVTLALSRLGVGEPRWDARANPACAGIASSSVRSGTRPFVATAFATRSSSSGKPRPAP